MEQFLNSLPRPILVGGALVVGLLLIFLLNPPHTKCNSQYEIFKSSQTPFLYKDPKKKFMEETFYQTTSSECRVRSQPGGCFKFFEGVRSLTKDIYTVSRECRSEVVSKSEVSQAIWGSLQLIFELAWGKEPPQNYLDKMGWLDSVHVSTFCELQSIAKENLGESAWNSFREKTMSVLPGANQLERKEVWNRSLFTLKCP